MEVQECGSTTIEHAATPLDEIGPGSDEYQEGLETIEGAGSSVLHGPVPNQILREGLRCRVSRPGRRRRGPRWSGAWRGAGLLFTSGRRNIGCGWLRTSCSMTQRTSRVSGSTIFL